jgi:ribosomal protein S18 acetylase RimI-like enzyme
VEKLGQETTETGGAFGELQGREDVTASAVDARSAGHRPQCEVRSSWADSLPDETMKAICLHDKASIERRLRQNVYLNIYSLGDLDDFFWPYTIWYGASDAQTGCVASLYIGQSLPALLAFCETAEPMCELLESVLHLLPRRFFAHLSPGLEAVFRSTHDLEPHGEHYKMALTDPSSAEGGDGRGTCELGPHDADEVLQFYSRCYPGNWFDPRMLETDKYFAIRESGRLVSIAGVHVYSRQYRVAALGNIATAPSHRNRGFGRRVTARTCQSLLKDQCDVGLNVKADNRAAIACYRGLGFETVASYGEYMVQRRGRPD